MIKLSLLRNPKILEVMNQDKEILSNLNKYPEEITCMLLELNFKNENYNNVETILKLGNNIEAWLSDSSHQNFMKQAIISHNLDIHLFLQYPKVLPTLLNDDSYIKFLLELDSMQFYQFFSHPIYYGDILRNFNIQEKMTQFFSTANKKNSPYLFRFMIDSLKNGNNDLHMIEQIENKRVTKIKSIIFSDACSLKECKELIADALFQTYLTNVEEDISVILEFSLEKEEWFDEIGKDNIILLKEFLNIMNQNSREKIQSYYYGKENCNYKMLLSDCMEKARMISSQDLCESITPIKALLQDNKVLKRKRDGVLLLELCGSNFRFFIHKSTHQNFKDYIPYEPMTSLSFITNYNIESEYDLENSFIYGFDTIPKESILHICSSDSFSLMFDKTMVIYKKPEYISSKTLAKRTQDYNEIVVSNTTDSGKTIVPNYLLTYDEPNEQLIQIAKDNGIPIVKINKEYYKQDNNKIK